MSLNVLVKRSMAVKSWALRERIIKISCDDFPVRDKNPYLWHSKAQAKQQRKFTNGFGLRAMNVRNCKIFFLWRCLFRRAWLCNSLSLLVCDRAQFLCNHCILKRLRNFENRWHEQMVYVKHYSNCLF